MVVGEKIDTSLGYKDEVRGTMAVVGDDAGRGGEEEGAVRKGGVEGGKDVPVVKGRECQGRRPWRLNQDVPRAGLDTVIAGVGYLL